ncbi:MAG: transcriptional regulator [Proteobacteria bacterium SG_bin6]|nr:MAG: transcriptional regulator [Proteobacteria bacterium SG_bin6]
MITALRDLRLARGMTLDQVARACVPPTTPQTIGRLEMGTRTVSLAWLARIAPALAVTPAELLQLPTTAALPVVALVGPEGAVAPRKTQQLAPPQAPAGALALRVVATTGEYRAGDVLWCDRLAPERLPQALNRDILVPRAAGRFAFGRLTGVEAARLQLQPLLPGARQMWLATPAWFARVATLVRDYGRDASSVAGGGAA